jgi:hypothetical protein
MPLSRRSFAWAAGAWLLVTCPAAAQSPSEAVSPAVVRPSNQVGVVAAVQGNVELASGKAVGLIVHSAGPVFLGDVVTTDGEGRLQILLLDETIFTIGPNSAIVIDEFVYDPATSNGTLSAKILRGVFRFVSGRIAHENPEQMKVQLPVGTIGVRGTMVVGKVEGQRSVVALVGPGSVVVSNPVANSIQQVAMSRPGYGTVIEGPNIPPAPPAFVPPAQINAFMMALGPPPSGPMDASRQGPPGPNQGPPGSQPQPGQPGPQPELPRLIQRPRDPGADQQVARARKEDPVQLHPVIHHST